MRTLARRTWRTLVTLVLVATGLAPREAAAASRPSRPDSTVMERERARIIKVTLDPVSGSATVATNTFGSMDYAVHNVTGGSLTVSLTVTGCTGTLTNCSSTPTSVTLAGGETRTVTGRFKGGSAGTATIVMKALDGGGLTIGTAPGVTVTVTPPPQMSVTANAGTVQGTAGQAGSAAFTITNTGSVSAPANLGANCSGAGITGVCTVSPTSATLAVGASQTVTISFTAANAGGSGTATMTATNSVAGGAYGSASSTINVPPPAPQVTLGTPGPTSAGPGQTVTSTFTVTNTGYVTAPIAYTVSCDGVASSCGVAAGAPASLAPTASGSVNVTIQTAPAGGTGTVTLNVWNSDTWWQYASGGTTVTATPPPPQVATSANAASVQGTAGQAGSATFTISNTGYVSAPVTLTPTCSGGGLTSTCTVSPSSTTLAAGASATVTIGFAFVAAGGTGTVSLAATNSSTGSSYGTAPSTSVSAAPPPPQMSVQAAAILGGGAGAQGQAPFWITNTGVVNAPVTLTATCSGAGVLATPCDINIATSQTFAPGEYQYMVVTFQAAAAGGTGTITLVATNSSTGAQYASVTSTNTAAPPPPQVAVSPTGGTMTGSPGQVGSAMFTVANTGHVTAPITFSASCSGSGLTNCSPSPTTTSLAVGASMLAAVNFTAASAGGTGTAKLIATNSSTGAVFDSSSRVVNTPPPPFDVTTFHGGTTIERGLCPTVAIVADVAAQCGALRITHALPATTTYGKQYAPTLAYFSDHTMGPHVLVKVALNGATPPDSVAVNTYDVDVNGNRTALILGARFGGVNWAASDAQTFNTGYLWSDAGHLTGIYTLDVEVQFKAAGGGWYSAGPVQRGKVAVVQRRGSPFGNGWWMLGLEEVYLQGDNSFLWVGGDGSTRRYASVAVIGDTTVYVAPTVTRPDTLFRSNSSGWLRRALSGRVNVFFDGLGRHRMTKGREGRITFFEYEETGGRGRLQEIILPGDKRYLLVHTDPMITVYASGGRTAKINFVGAQSHAVASIRDADTSTVSFTYYSSWGQDFAINGRTDRRLTPTTLNWNSYAVTLQSGVTTVGASTAIQTIVSPRGRNAYRAGGQAATAADQPDYTFDGPRTDVADVTKIWVDTLGAVTRTNNALQHETVIERGDPRLPALPTRVIAPNLLETRATYDSRGHLTMQSVINPLGDGRDAVTSYEWDSVWDELTKVTLPEGEVMRYGVDPSTGDRIWQQDGRGDSTRVTYSYVGGLITSVTQPGGRTDSLTYDALGNVATMRTAMGFRTVYTRDPIGRVTAVRTPTDSAQTPALVRIDSTVYDAADRVRRTLSIAPSVSFTLTKGTSTTIPLDTAVVRIEVDSGGLVTVVERYGSPDPGSVGSLLEQTFYDALGRVIRKVKASAGTHLYGYDLASNLIADTIPGGNVLRMEYDVLGRLVKRISPDRTENAQSCSQFFTFIGAGSDATLCTGRDWRFPIWGSQVAITGDSAQFTYDASGNMIRASNRDALITRGYSRTGAIVGDTLLVRSFGTQTFTPPHLYALGYAYDLSGRRTSLVVPGALQTDCVAVSSCVQTYQYVPGTDLLASTVDAHGGTHAFYHDAAGRLYRRTSPGNVSEGWTFDPDGRVKHRSETGWVASLHEDELRRDAEGRVVGAYATVGWSDASSQNHFVRNLYNTRGGLVASEDAYAQGIYPATEEFTLDPLGHQLRHEFNGTETTRTIESFSYLRERLLSQTGEWQPPGGKSVTTQTDVLRRYGQDGAEIGSLSRTYSSDPNSGRSALLDVVGTRSYYDAEGHLRFHARAGDYRKRSTRDLFEEYWYDALGRRVLVRSQADSTCAQGDDVCRSAVTRFIWDGVQLLSEQRVTAGHTAGNGTLDRAGMQGGSYDGQVLYTHAGGIDAPIAIARNGVVMMPHANWRGLFDSGTLSSGARAPADADWPGNGARAYLVTDGWEANLGWAGSLVDGKKDESGLMYMRNRYLDPATGRFTQNDPIGLAGGVNEYGFANGDPVNYADPFGLCPDPTAPGLGQLQCVFEDIGAGARQWASSLVSSGEDGARRTAVYVRGGAGVFTTTAEVGLDGRAALRAGGAVGTQAIGAAVGVKVDIQAAPADAVSGRLSRRVGPSIGGVAGVSITTGIAVGPTSGMTVTSVGVEIGAGLSRTPSGRGLPVSGSAQVPHGGVCLGDRCNP